MVESNTQNISKFNKSDFVVPMLYQLFQMAPQVVAVEPNLNFLRKAQAAADRADIQLQLRQGDAGREWGCHGNMMTGG